MIAKSEEMVLFMNVNTSLKTIGVIITKITKRVTNDHYYKIRTEDGVAFIDVQHSVSGNDLDGRADFVLPVEMTENAQEAAVR